MNDECKLNGHNVHLERSAWKMRTSGIVCIFIQRYLTVINKNEDQIKISDMTHFF